MTAANASVAPALGTPEPAVVTFDLFSALIDSRRGGSSALGRLARERGWPVTGEELYDAWDARNKAAQRDCATWVPYAELAGAALADTYAALRLDGEPTADVATLLRSLPDWPLWPDVRTGLADLATRHRIGILSNVDDALFARTQAAALVDPALVLTSERLRAYKPSRRIYAEAHRLVGPLVHVATSARDVRGALEADLPVVRLRRPGHQLDPEGPMPAQQAESIGELAPLLDEAR